MENHILEVIGTKNGYVKSANGVSLGRFGGKTSFFSREQYPLIKDYFRYIMKESWELISKSASGHLGEILYIFEGQHKKYITFDGSRRYQDLSYKIKWEGGYWEPYSRLEEDAIRGIVESTGRTYTDDLYEHKGNILTDLFHGRYHVNSEGQEYPLTRMEVIQEYSMRFLVIGAIIFVIVLAIAFCSGAP